jgi:hypothetical protein
MPVEFTPDGQRDLDSLTPEEQRLLTRALEAELAAVHGALRQVLGRGWPDVSPNGVGVLRLRSCVVLLVVSVQRAEAEDS